MDKKDRMAEITEQLEQGVKDFFTSEKIIHYLDIMSRFHRYSLNNQILIARQKPDATYVAGYNAWIKNFDRHVKKNETGIRILAPQKHQIEVETDRVDESGNAVKEKREVISFRPVTVFDVSQTEGKELPELITELNGDVANYNTMMEAVAVAAPFHINIQEVTGEAKGWCDYVSENIVIKAGMSELQTIKTAIHETAHARLHSLPHLTLDDVRKKQCDIIQKTNPKWEGTHSTWIEKPEDVRTFYEAAHKDSDYPFDDDYTEDWAVSDKIKAEASGQITVYSSKPIIDGNWVTPSKEEALSYSGDGKIYSAMMDVRDIAWVDIGQGQVAHISDEMKKVIDRATREEAQDKQTGKMKDRGTKEVEAEGCAYAVCNHFGLDTSDYSFGYVAVWAQGQPEEVLKQSMQTIHEEAKNIIEIIENHFSEKERMIDGVRPKELEDAAKEKVDDVLNELMPFSEAEAVNARFYGSYKLPDEPRVAKVMVEYTGGEREDDVFNAICENPVCVNGVKLDINPIRPDKSGNVADYYREVKRFERAEMEDDTWPMITVTYSSCKQIATGKQMSIYEAVSVIDKVDERLSKENLKGNFLRINVSYTYAGRKEEQTDVVILGEGRRNFLDYLNISADVNRYMHRHIQILDTVDAARSTLSKGSRVAGMYEDMMLEWAENARRELNYNVEPEIKKPPELYSKIKTHENWEMLR